MESLEDFIYRCGCDVEFIGQKVAELEKFIDGEAEERSEKMVEEKFNAKNEEVRLSVLREIDAANKKNKRIMLTKHSQFITECITLDGIELSSCDFINTTFRRNPGYEDIQLVYNGTVDEYQVIYKNGKRKMVSEFVVTICIIVNPISPGKCKAIVVYLQGRSVPLIFYDGDISPQAIMQQTRFEKRGINVSNSIYCASFIEAIRACTAMLFLMIPEHFGMNQLPDGKYDYTSMLSVIPGLENLYSDEIKNHKLIQHEYKFIDIAKEHKAKISDNFEMCLAIIIRVTSLLLLLYDKMQLTPDRCFLFLIKNDIEKADVIAVTKRSNYSSTVTKSLSSRISSTKEELALGNDTTVLFSLTGDTVSPFSVKNSLSEIRMELAGENGNENPTRKLICIVTDTLDNISDEYPAYCIPFSSKKIDCSVQELQELSGKLDYSLIQYITNNPDAANNLLEKSVVRAKKTFGELDLKVPLTDTLVMILSSAFFLMYMGVVEKSFLNHLLYWIANNATAKFDYGKNICYNIGNILSKAICSGKITVTNQFSPPFWSNDKAFVAGDDSINMLSEVFENKIVSRLSIRKNRALQYLKDEDMIAACNPNENQRTLLVLGENGKKIKKRFVSLSPEMLTSDAWLVVNKSKSSDIFHGLEEFVDDFYPYIKHMELNTVAGSIITDYKVGNPFMAVTGTPGSGKTDFLIMQAFQRALAGKNIVVLDPTNSFKNDELLGHKIPLDLINKHCVFWDMSTMGFPVNILDFDGCEDITQRVQRLSSLLISGMHLTGPNQKAIVITKAEEWLKKYEKNNTLSIFSLLQRFDDNADDERKLKTKLNALLSTVKKTDNTVQPPGWDKLLSEQGKVLVISAGSATINVEANPFDILLDTLYSFKDKHKEIAMTVILDEVQTLNHHKNSTLVNILSRGRKLNLSVILASQDYSDEKIGLGMVYAYCGTKVFFRPLGDECVNVVAKITHIDHDIIATLPNFTCAVSGAVYSKHYGKNIIPEKAIIGVTYRPPYVGNYDKNE